MVRGWIVRPDRQSGVEYLKVARCAVGVVRNCVVVKAF